MFYRQVFFSLGKIKKKAFFDSEKSNEFVKIIFLLILTEIPLMKVLLFALKKAALVVFKLALS